MRLPSECTEDGALAIHGDCREGENVRLAYGDPSRILDASYNSRIDIMSFEPEAILLFNCVSRRIFLREDTNQELQPVRAIAPNAGLYVLGEIFRDEVGNVVLLNMAMVVASFREGPQGGAQPRALALAPRMKKLTDMMKLVQCLANFVAITSAESEIANEQLVQLASIDRLTGLYNRGEIESILRRELLQHRRRDGVLSAIMIDLDNFKSVNDTFGHAVGDETLRWSAAAIRKAIRRSDAAGRWGGEEFFIILPYTPLEAAANVAERIRAALDAGHTLPDGQSVTGSLGVAKFPASGNYMKFYQQLDEALYRAKQDGKNRVCIAEEE
jgi:diguanylate cyclase (GGDEF)-like protein